MFYPPDPTQPVSPPPSEPTHRLALTRIPGNQGRHLFGIYTDGAAARMLATIAVWPTIHPGAPAGSPVGQMPEPPAAPPIQDVVLEVTAGVPLDVQYRDLGLGYSLAPPMRHDSPPRQLGGTHNLLRLILRPGGASAPSHLVDIEVHPVGRDEPYAQWSDPTRTVKLVVIAPLGLTILRGEVVKRLRQRQSATLGVAAAPGLVDRPPTP